MKNRILLATGVALVLLIFEWWLICLGQSGLSQIDINRTLLALSVTGVVIGLGCGIVATLASRWLDPRLSAPAFAVAGLGFLKMFAAQDATLAWNAVVSSIALGILAFFVVYKFGPRLPVYLCEARYWCLMALAAFALNLGLSARSALDSTGVVSALIATAISFGLVGWAVRSRDRSFLLIGVGFTVLLAANAFIAQEVPAIGAESKPGNNLPSVLLVTIDTLRADHVGAYGNPNARTPNLDRLAQQGIVFKQTVTANAYTGPSHASILTGLLPSRHRVVKNRVRIPPDVTTLADTLRDKGYLTAAFVSGYTTQDAACGLPSRFQYYDDDIRAVRWLPKAGFKVAALRVVEKFQKFSGWHRGEFGQSYRQAAETADTAIDWLEVNGDRPYFVWVHFFDPHSPYRPPEKYVNASTKRAGVSGVWYELSRYEKGEIVNSPEKIKAMIDLYDAEIAYADEQLGRVLEVARRKSSDRKMIVIATSDHGESMGEHDLYWERDLYDPTALVPLIINTSDPAPTSARTVDAQVRLIDIAPTVLDLVGVEASLQLDGQSMTGLIRGATIESTGPAFSEKFHVKAIFPQVRTVRTADWKYMQRFPGWDGSMPRRAPVKELYHLPRDRQEESNLINRGTPVPDGFDSLLEAQGLPEVEELDLNDEDRERLRSLGYIQ